MTCAGSTQQQPSGRVLVHAKTLQCISFHTVAGICTDTIVAVALSRSLVSQRTNLLRRCRRGRCDHQHLLLG
jgi:hypothetical protein